jgi:hypothetical protein
MSMMSSVRAADLPQASLPQRDPRGPQRTTPGSPDPAPDRVRTTPANDPEAQRNRSIARATKPDPEGRLAQEQAGREALQAADRYASHGRPAHAPSPPRLRIDA